MKRRAFLRGAVAAMALAVAPIAYNVARLELGGRRVYYFAPGEATGNLTEIGVGSGGAYTRLELPDTITVLADEAVEIVTEYRPGGPPRVVCASIIT